MRVQIPTALGLRSHERSHEDSPPRREAPEVLVLDPHFLQQALGVLEVGIVRAVVPVGTAGLEAGSRVELEMFRWPEGRTEQEVLNV